MPRYFPINNTVDNARVTRLLLIIPPPLPGKKKRYKIQKIQRKEKNNRIEPGESFPCKNEKGSHWQWPFLVGTCVFLYHVDWLLRPCYPMNQCQSWRDNAVEIYLSDVYGRKTHVMAFPSRSRPGEEEEEEEEEEHRNKKHSKQNKIW